MITGLFVEGQTASEVAARYGVHRAWVYKLKARYLAEAGLDAGADTIGWHLEGHHQITLSRATIHRILTRAGAVVPEPGKRPRSSYLRFAADQPNECWQSDFTHYRLTTRTGRPGADVEIISWLDDHARYALRVTAHHRITGPIVVSTFRETVAQHGVPASTLTDNGMAYTTRLSGGKAAATASRPNYAASTWSRRSPSPPPSPNSRPCSTRSSRSTTTAVRTDPFHPLPHRATPATTYHARPKAAPNTDRTADTHDRVRTDRLDDTGVVTLRVNGRLHHIGIGRTHARTHVFILVQDLHIRVVHATTGELLRELTLDPTKDYQPAGRPRGPIPKRTGEPTNRGFTCRR
ncbi:DDE-type integrase/transposase/recombinase [Kribbella sp. GL6]|uniref:DDE-type integrase/transposase/recombinase n=1 Tax=Kribbella sp. GL6 TaxID=3419765 RepID=UPI003D015187